MKNLVTPTLFDKLVADHEGGALTGHDTARSDVKASMPGQERRNASSVRATVLRELDWLLNTTNFSAAHDLALHPQVVTSVLNYGLGELAGKLLDRRHLVLRARDIRDAVVRFEPRIVPASLSVEPGVSARASAITFTIRGDVSQAAAALPVAFRTDVEIDTGAVTLGEN